MVDFTLTHTTGLVGGLTIQFAEGAWPGEIGAGLTMSEAAFVRIIPLVLSACSGWTRDHRWGVYEVSRSERKDLARRLRDQALVHGENTKNSAEAAFLRGLADWLDDHADYDGPISILGI